MALLIKRFPLIRRRASDLFFRSFSSNYFRKTDDLTELWEFNNKEKARLNKETFTDCSIHSPNYFWIGCSDARIPASEGTGQKPGNMFVHRNLGNLVMPSDPNFVSVLQYAVNYLQIPHIIVCGHYDCRGIETAMDQRDHHNPLESWLSRIRDVYFDNHVELDAITDKKMRNRRVVELNVIAQCINLYKMNMVQRRRIQTFQDDSFSFAQPRIHALVFDSESALLKELDVKFKEYLKHTAGIFDLYELDPMHLKKNREKSK